MTALLSGLETFLECPLIVLRSKLLGPTNGSTRPRSVVRQTPLFGQRLFVGPGRRPGVPVMLATWLAREHASLGSQAWLGG